MRPIDRRCLLTSFAIAALALAPAARAADVPDGPAPRPVRVERVRPKHESLPTLRFLRANREFFRSRLDQIHEVPLALRGDAQELDPRYLAWRELLASVNAAADTVDTSEAEDQRRTLFASVTELGRLEQQLDTMDRLLARQRERLASLQADFAGHQHTALAVVVSGWPQAGGPDSVAIALEDGTQLSLPLSAAQRAALADGGVLELFHGLIEPREQTVAVAIAGHGAAADSGFVTLAPPRDRLTFLRLDLSGAAAPGGAGGITATTWLHDDAPDADRERTNRP